MSETPREQNRIERVATTLERIIDWVEVTVAVILAAVIVMAVAYVAVATLRLLTVVPTPGNGNDELLKVIKYVLDTFLVIELFRITVAYVRHHEIIPTVLETALVVAAREIVVIEAGAKNPLSAAAVGGTLIAVGITWYLLRRAGACESDSGSPS